MGWGSLTSHFLGDNFVMTPRHDAGERAYIVYFWSEKKSIDYHAFYCHMGDILKRLVITKLVHMRHPLIHVGWRESK